MFPMVFVRLPSVGCFNFVAIFSCAGYVAIIAMWLCVVSLSPLSLSAASLLTTSGSCLLLTACFPPFLLAYSFSMRPVCLTNTSSLYTIPKLNCFSSWASLYFSGLRVFDTTHSVGPARTLPAFVWKYCIPLHFACCSCSFHAQRLPYII